jgi:hypothetical protein
MRRLAVLVVVGPLLLTACQSSEDEAAEERESERRVAEAMGVEQACADSMQRAAETRDPDAVDPLVERTLWECDSVEEWQRALALYPAAIGAQAAESADVVIVCSYFLAEAEDSPVCRDAEAASLLDSASPAEGADAVRDSLAENNLRLSFEDSDEALNRAGRLLCDGARNRPGDLADSEENLADWLSLTVEELNFSERTGGLFDVPRLRHVEAERIAGFFLEVYCPDVAV